MEYFRKDDLEEIRRSDNDLSLYAVYGSLAHPPIKIKLLTKKYVYWLDDSKHVYPSKAAGYSIFDSPTEAWKKYKFLYDQRKNYIREKYEQDMQQLTRATEILNTCAEQTPEYFI